MLTWEGISYIIKGFISNTKLVILGLANSSESPYCLPDPCSHSETQNTLDSSANVKSAIITGMWLNMRPLASYLWYKMCT